MTVERGASARSARQPRLRLAIEPIYGLDVGLERAYLLNGAIGPFSFRGTIGRRHLGLRRKLVYARSLIHRAYTRVRSC